MRVCLKVFFLLLVFPYPAIAKVVVFHQNGFPTVDSQPIEQETMRTALGEMQPVFAGIEELKNPETFRDTDLLVLPYGSAFPADAWKQISAYLQEGGNLLTLGGRPLFVPVFRARDGFEQAPAQNTFSRYLGIWHTYEAPQKGRVKFVWDEDYSFLPPIELRARKVYVAGMWWGSGANRGMGYLVNPHGARVAAPVVEEDFRELSRGEAPALLGPGA